MEITKAAKISSDITVSVTVLKALQAAAALNGDNEVVSICQGCLGGKSTLDMLCVIEVLREEQYRACLASLA